jgi:hypothetical protein
VVDPINEVSPIVNREVNMEEDCVSGGVESISPIVR